MSFGANGAGQLRLP